PPHAAMTFLVVPIPCFLSTSPPRPQPPASRPLMRLTYSSAHRYLILCLTQSPCLSVPCAVSHPASLASIANSNSVPTISISVPTVATSIVVLALTLTTPMVIGPTLTPASNSPPRSAQVARRPLSNSPPHAVSFAHHPSMRPISGVPRSPPRSAQITRRPSSSSPPHSV